MSVDVAKCRPCRAGAVGVQGRRSGVQVDPRRDNVPQPRESRVDTIDNKGGGDKGVTVKTWLALTALIVRVSLSHEVVKGSSSRRCRRPALGSVPLRGALHNASVGYGGYVRTAPASFLRVARRVPLRPSSFCSLS